MMAILRHLGSHLYRQCMATARSGNARGRHCLGLGDQVSHQEAAHDHLLGENCDQGLALVVVEDTDVMAGIRQHVDLVGT